MLTLRELLDTFTPDQCDTLRKSLHLKEDATATKLQQRLDNSDRTRKLFEGLEPIDKHVLRYVLSQGGAVAESEIIALYPDAPPAIEKLRLLYLLFDDPQPLDGDGRTVCLPREYARFVPLTPAEKSTLANLLARQPASYGQELAQTYGWPETLSKRHQIAQLKRRWLNEAALRDALGALSESERSLWNMIVSADGILDVKLLQRHGVSPTTVQPGHLERSRPLDSLYAKGLIFPNQLPSPTCFVIPTDVSAQLKEKKVAKTFETFSHGPASLRTWGLRLLSDLQLFAGYQASGRLQFTQNEIPLRHQLRGFLKAVGIDEEAYGLFVNVSMEAFFGPVIKRTTHTLDANPAESMSRLIAHWRDSEAWQESMHWRDAHRSPDGQTDRTLKAKRMILLKALEELPTKQWVAYRDFETHVFASGWKRVDSGIQSNAAFYHNERWPRHRFVADLSPEDILAAMVAEPLVWLGLIDVGIEKSRKRAWAISHLRLTDWGRQFLDKKTGRIEPLPAVAAENQFRVLPNLDISVSPRLRPDLLAQLFKVATLKGVNTFSLTKESLREALDEGMTAKEILKFLQENSGRELPSMVQQFVEEVGERHGHIKLGIAGAYLQVDDPVLMVELRAHRSLQDIFRKQIGDRLSILNDSDLERIAKVLRKMGYFPVIEKSDETERLKQKFHW